MKAHWLLAATAGFCLVGVSATLGHTGDRVYPFYEITEELLGTIDLTDGSVEDWIEVGPPSLTLLDFFVWEIPITPIHYSDIPPIRMSRSGWAG